MGKSTHFIGQPILGQLLKFLDKEKIIKMSRENDGERYVKKFNAWNHLVIMLYAVIMRYDSIREITSTTEVECRKLAHLGVDVRPRRSTLSDANARRPESIFGMVYADLYNRCKPALSSDSRKGVPKGVRRRMRIIDSTTISLFSNLVFKGVGRNPNNGKKKGGIKVHTDIYANEFVPNDIKFTSAATHDSFMLAPERINPGEILAIDRAYIDYAKLEALTQRGVVYVTKMKQGLAYETVSSTYHMGTDGKMQWREEIVTFRKKGKKNKDGETTPGVEHKARIITYVKEEGTRSKRYRLVRLLTNDLDTPYEEIIEIYRERWGIEELFKQIKQNFPLKYFYGESANAIKIQIWVVLIANLLLTMLQRSIERKWSFSGLATMVRILCLSYLNVKSLLEHPEKDWEMAVKKAIEIPPEEE